MAYRDMDTSIYATPSRRGRNYESRPPLPPLPPLDLPKFQLNGMGVLEYTQKLDQVQRENFDLRMRIASLEDRMKKDRLGREVCQDRALGRGPRPAEGLKSVTTQTDTIESQTCETCANSSRKTAAAIGSHARPATRKRRLLSPDDNLDNNNLDDNDENVVPPTPSSRNCQECLRRIEDLAASRKETLDEKTAVVELSRELMESKTKMAELAMELEKAKLEAAQSKKLSGKLLEQDEVKSTNIEVLKVNLARTSKKLTKAKNALKAKGINFPFPGTADVENL